MQNKFCLIITSAEPWETWPRKPFIKQIANTIHNDGGVILGIEPSILSVHTFIFYPTRILKWVARKYKFRKVDKNIYVFSPFTIEHLLVSVRSKALLYINKKLIKYQLLKHLRKIVVNPQNTIFILHRPELYFLKGIINEKGVVYDCSDDFCLTSRMVKLKVQGNKEREKLLASKSNFVIATSKKLYNRNIIYNRNTFLMINGYSSNVFNNFIFKPIQLLEDLKKPIIGYIGNIRDWVDFVLLEYVILKKPEWTFLFVGTVRNESKKQFRKLEQKFKNLISIKSVNYENYPNYLKYFDVGIIPFRTNEFMESVNPNKLSEYLGAGVPVVSTNIGDLKNDFYKYVKVGINEQDFKNKLEIMVEKYKNKNRNDRNEIIEYSKQFTWENNSVRLYNYMKKYISTFNYII